MQVQNIVLYDGTESSYLSPSLATATSSSDILASATASRPVSHMPRLRGTLQCQSHHRDRLVRSLLLPKFTEKPELLDSGETGGSAARFGAYEYVSSLLRRNRVTSDGSSFASGITLFESTVSGAVSGITRTAV
ncbi:hypothetical protein V1525DRAFT_440572 [Lipomyces kononenkoae]|uniref:Uncharacterized protein n=1 Tax=Lipomyces kononenkoae TaxID=34357 RepID=A0ACC3SR85_LIPKO